MAFAAGLRGGWDALLLVYFVGCGISRLARYNVSATAAAAASTKVTFFEGFPIPSSLLLVAVLAVLAATGRWQEQLPFGAITILGLTLHPLALLFGLHGSAMVSKTLRIPKP
jgi:CDP-diacylglycerol--serine O-phosphatidyltransferase